MLIAAGALNLSWLPLILTLPIHEAGLVFVSGWFAMIVLVNLSVRTALAFIVLAMANERRELERCLDALTDPQERIKYPISASSARRFSHRRRNSIWTPRSPNITAV
jgi:hypothetical protein